MPAKYPPGPLDRLGPLSGEMGINRTLWARACDVMGREYAAVAMAIVSTRPEGHFTLRKFKKNPQDLCLARTLWKLKDETWGPQRHKERREREKARRRSTGLEPTITPTGGFTPVGTVLQRQLAAPPPARRALPAPADRLAARDNSGHMTSIYCVARLSRGPYPVAGNFATEPADVGLGSTRRACPFSSFPALLRLHGLTWRKS
jgi:hypothetical protein